MKHEPGIFDEPDLNAEAASEARGLADIKAGRVISNAAVIKWMSALAEGRRLPRPKIGD